MNLDSQYALLSDYRETVIGLRTGETGRANTHLDPLLGALSIQLQRMSADAQRSAMPVINRMLSAKERDDTLMLADCLEFELPATLEEGEFSPTLLNSHVIGQLQSIAAKRDRADSGDTTAEAIQGLYARNPGVAGLGAYFAGRLYLERRYRDAQCLLEIDRDHDRLTPGGAYLLALVLARADADNMEQAVSIMAGAYASSRVLQDGLLQLGWVIAERGDWDRARELMEDDLRRGRTHAQGKADLSFVLAHLDQWQAAEQLVREAYAEDPSLTDRLGWIGWIGFLKGLGADYLAAHIAEDTRLQRSAIWGQIFAACHATAIGDVESAERQVEKAYADLPGEHSWFCAIGWLCVKSGDIRTGCRLMERDFAAGSMPDFWKPSYAVALAIHGEREKARGVLASAGLQRAGDQRNPIGYWHVPDARMTVADMESRIADIRRFAELNQPTDGAKLKTG